MDLAAAAATVRARCIDGLCFFGGRNPERTDVEQDVCTGTEENYANASFAAMPRRECELLEGALSFQAALASPDFSARDAGEAPDDEAAERASDTSIPLSSKSLRFIIQV